MYRLVIAEKPSVAMSIAKVLGATARKEGHMEGRGSPVATSKCQRHLEAPTEPTGEAGWLVSWCIGHLAGLAEPTMFITCLTPSLFLTGPGWTHWAVWRFLSLFSCFSPPYPQLWEAEQHPSCPAPLERMTRNGLRKQRGIPWGCFI